ncbi:sigma-54-dependent transcriptional regulator [Curvivirga sp.]|uniref:sigma-54-dependent transcriptional regulator n=1 Tax=Curvivirga sp. TaxID=2856848 RepID=UPI003B59009D
MSIRPRVLLVEDTPSLSLLYKQYMSELDVDVKIAETGKFGLQLIQEWKPNILLLDIELPDMNGLDLLKVIQENELPINTVVITAHGSVAVAVDAMRTGAYDFIVKPFNANRLRVTITNALEQLKLTELVESIKDSSRANFEGFVGSSLSMQAVYRIIDSAATSKATVFITGESGTGKEVCAEAIHRQSKRAENPFIAINCGAIPRDLMESEIFGHKKGAFTGATADRDGAATMANGGTLFLDEIGEMPMELQTKLLRFIQTGTFQKVGGSQVEEVNVRFICATNRDVLEEVEQGNFREDLYYRLHVIPIPMPPLRERGEDILLIARKFLRDYTLEEEKNFRGFGEQVERILATYKWPGNVRELQNIIRNIVVLNDGEIVQPEMLPPPLSHIEISPEQAKLVDAQIAKAGHAMTMKDPTTVSPLWIAEKSYIEMAIQVCEGNIPQAAKKLEVAPSTLYRKIESWKSKAVVTTEAVGD